MTGQMTRCMSNPLLGYKVVLGKHTYHLVCSVIYGPIVFSKPVIVV